jgi:hypothetical protein
VESTAFSQALVQYDPRTISRARERLGVESKQSSEGAGGITNTWHFPGQLSQDLPGFPNASEG